MGRIYTNAPIDLVGGGAANMNIVGITNPAASGRLIRLRRAIICVGGAPTVADVIRPFFGRSTNIAAGSLIPAASINKANTGQADSIAVVRINGPTGNLTGAGAGTYYGAGGTLVTGVGLTAPSIHDGLGDIPIDLLEGQGFLLGVDNDSSGYRFSYALAWEEI